MSAGEMKTFESQLEGLSFAEQLYVMKYLLKLMQFRQQNETANEKDVSVKAVLGKCKAYSWRIKVGLPRMRCLKIWLGSGVKR